MEHLGINSCKKLFRNRIIALAVWQILKIWSPCSVGNMFFVDPRAAWECSFRFVQQLCGANARQYRFPHNFKRILQVLPFELSMRASLFVMFFLKSEIPTKRGDHIFKLNSREVNYFDAEMIQSHRETHQKRILSVIDQCAVYVSERTSAISRRQCGHSMS